MGYDFPFLLHRFIPFYSGAPAHDMHHLRPLSCFEPWLNYLDRIFGIFCFNICVVLLSLAIFSFFIVTTQARFTAAIYAPIVTKRTEKKKIFGQPKAFFPKKNFILWPPRRFRSAKRFSVGIGTLTLIIFFRLFFILWNFKANGKK